MSLPPLLPPTGKPEDWIRRAATLVNQIAQRLMDVGVTGDRPANPRVGQQRFNVTLGKPEWWDGANWVTW